MFGIKFANTTPDIAAEGLRAVINDQLSRNFYHSGYYDDPISMANMNAMRSGPWLSTVIEESGNTFKLRAVVKSSETYGTIGDLIAMLCGLDDYPLMDDEQFTILIHNELMEYLARTYPGDDSGDLAMFLYENGNEAPYLESGMSLYIPDEDSLIAEWRETHPLDSEDSDN